MPSKIEMEQERHYSQMLARAWRVWQALDGIMREEMSDSTIIREVRIQGPNLTGGGYRAIIKADMGGQRVVAFHNAETPEELIAGLVERVNTDAARWREDKPYTGQGGGS